MLIKDIFGPSIMIAIENNNYYPTDAYRHVTDTEFISTIVYDNDVMFLFDNAHARVTAHNVGIDYHKYRDALPMDKLVQIQFCEPMIPNSGLARDVHDYPSLETINEIKGLVDLYHVQYITPEYYKDILRLRELLMMLGEMYGPRSNRKDGNNNWG